MPVFSYKAIDHADVAVAGVVSGDSARQVRDQLRAQGLVVQELREQNASDARTHSKAGDAGKVGVGSSRGIDGVAGNKSDLHRSVLPSFENYQAKIAEMTGELSTLLSVGVPLLEAIDTINKHTTRRFKTALMLVRDQVEAGSSVAEAMARQPKIFDSLTVNMVEVGENAGNLDVVLRRLADFKLQSQQFKDRVMTALTYPAIVFFVAIGVSLFLMTFVVPMLLSNLEEAGKALPWPTVILKFFSDLLLQYWPALAGISCTGMVVFVLAIRTDWGKRLWYRILLKVPVIGKIALKQEIARVCMVISTLLGSGIVFLKALEIASDSGMYGSMFFATRLFSATPFS